MKFNKDISTKTEFLMTTRFYTDLIFCKSVSFTAWSPVPATDECVSDLCLCGSIFVKHVIDESLSIFLTESRPVSALKQETPNSNHNRSKDQRQGERKISCWVRGTGLKRTVYLWG